MYSHRFQISVEKSAPSFDLRYGTVMTKLKFFRVVEKNVSCSTNVRDKLPFVNSTKSLIFGLTKILLPKHLNSYTLFDCEGYALSVTFYRIKIEL